MKSLQASQTRSGPGTWEGGGQRQARCACPGVGSTGGQAAAGVCPHRDPLGWEEVVTNERGSCRCCGCSRAQMGHKASMGQPGPRLEAEGLCNYHHP